MNDHFRPACGRWPRSRRFLVAAGVLIGVLAASRGWLPPEVSAVLRMPDLLRVTPVSPDLAASSERAETIVRRAQDFVRQARAAEGVVPDPEGVPDASGLIGAELTPLVTTLGSLEAKRISTNPAWARVLVTRMAAAGVRRDTVVAAGFSGSFPALNLAVMAACEALGAHLVAISSVTASTWGANQPGFTWPELEVRLARAGLVRRVSVAVSAGGADDRAHDLEAEGRDLAERIRDVAASDLGVAALSPASLGEAIEQRWAIYRREARGRPIVLYVNTGGTDASLGTSAAVLRLRSGLLPGVPFDFSPGRGLIARFAERGVPVLMLLNVRDLAVRWGIPLEGRQSP